MDYSILPKIKSPNDIKQLNNADTQILCDEIRDCIITTVSNNGGHLASNLGSVELTIALHKAFDSPTDSIIFDVGHQSYAHKLITGRFEHFSTLRTKGGISGFMKPCESEHDPFITGHSSNSISAAYGILKAKQLTNQKGSAIAVIGDGAMTGGMSFEAMNNAGNSGGNFIVVLNDNKMSISKNVGSFSRSLTKLRNRRKYHTFKFALTRILKKIPIIGKWLYRFVDKIKDVLKSIVYRNNEFLGLGFNYLGPVDGHDVSELIDFINALEQRADVADEKLKEEETRRYIEKAFRDGTVKTTGTDIDKLMPPVSRFGGGNRAAKKQGIIEKIQAFFEKYFGLVGVDDADI